MENYIGIFKANSNDERPIIKPSQKISFNASLESTQNKRFRLFFTGETNIHYTWKSENDCHVAYGKIDDSLSCEDSFRSQYCLKLKGCDYPKVIYKKLLSEVNTNILPANTFSSQKWQPALSYLPLGNFTDEWKFGIFARGENIVIKEDGKLKMTLEVRLAREGVSRHDIRQPADLSYEIDFSEGSYDWSELCRDIIIPTEGTISVCVFIEAENFEGTLYLESPYITSSNGFNILPDFTISGSQRSGYNWVGQNLSRKEWPCFELSINGEVFYSGELFERCHRNSECEVNIPDNLIKSGNNDVTIKLISDMHDAPAYCLNEVALIEEPRDEFNVVSCPEIIAAGKPFSLLLEVNEPTVIKVNSPIVSHYDSDELKFDTAGLYAVRLICDMIVNDLTFTLESDTHSEICKVLRSVEKPEDDNVITGTSDAVYIKQDKADMENYLKFFMSSHIGNLVTLRPVYRWSGTRKYNAELFKKLVPLMNKLGLKYANMTDGREPEGFCCNPPKADLERGSDETQSGFLGRQKHERDGSYNYWSWRGADSYEEQLSADLMTRAFLNDPEKASFDEHLPEECFYDGDKLTYYRPNNLPDDMQGMADYVVESLRKTRYDNTRHTGPSIMFKYFYEAGYDWVGAELMYGPLEFITAAMRGAYKSYGKKNGYGAHNALQWSTYPHDVEEKYRRYRLTLYLCYMHGISEINLEEGLYHIEEYFSDFNRFSDCCKAFLKEQQDFYRYTLSHTRTGEFYTPIAFLQGRYDGFSGFTRDRVWGREDFNFCDAEKSWDILKLFYPVSVLDGIYKHFCPTEEPVGFFTGTPRGNLDIIPIENGAFEHYKAISFTGYNKADESDLDNLLAFVQTGGTLIAGWPHLSVTTNRKDIESGKLSIINHKLVDYLCADANEFISDTYCGNSITVCPNVKCDDVIATTDSGYPLAFIKRIGLGQVFFVNAMEYPANAGVKPLYEVILSEVSDNLNAEEKIFLSCGKDVGFTIYDQKDGARHIYALAVDWYRDSSIMRHADLKLGKQKYKIDIPFGTMLKIVAKDSIAAWSEDEAVEILLITGNVITLQGYGKTKIKVAKNGEILEREIDFTHKPIQAIQI